MSYRLEESESLDEGLRRIAREEADVALVTLDEMRQGADLPEGIHTVRKSFKKIRAVLRMVRPVLGRALLRAEDHSFRDLGRQLAPVRDAWIVTEALERLSLEHGELSDDVADPLRERLEARHEALAEGLLHDGDVLGELSSTLSSARDRIASWPLTDDGILLISGGFETVYRRGREAMAEAYRRPSAEGFHDWRKRAKDLWYHLRLLEPLHPRRLSTLAQALDGVQEALGQANDLARLAQLLADERELAPDTEDLELVTRLALRRRDGLWREARDPARAVYAESPDAMVEGLLSSYRMWIERRGRREE